MEDKGSTLIFEGVYCGDMKEIIRDGITFQRKETEERIFFVNKDILPLEMFDGNLGCDPKTVLENSGVKFLGIIKGNPKYQHVELPEGWEWRLYIISTGYSELVDGNGRLRALIGKILPYDNPFDLQIERRFNCSAHTWPDRAKGCVTDCGKTIYETKEITNKRKIWLFFKRSEIDVGRIALQEAQKWLNQNYPDWRNPLAYW